MCLCVHTLPPACIHFREAVIKAAISGQKFEIQRACVSLLWLVQHNVTLINSSCHRDVKVWLLWMESKQTISSCVTTKTSIIANNVNSARTLLHPGLRPGEVGHLGARVWQASERLLWAGKQGNCGRPISHFRTEQMGEILIVVRFPCPLRCPQSADDKDGEFLLREWHSWNRIAFCQGAVCHLGLWFVGRGGMSRKGGIHSVPSIVVLQRTACFTLWADRDLKVQRQRQDDWLFQIQ